MDEVRRTNEEAKDNPVILAFARECAGREALTVWECLQWLTAQRDDMTQSMEAWRDLCRQREIQIGLLTDHPKSAIIIFGTTMSKTFLTIFETILGIGEAIVPIFIHNPQSQKIEGIIVTTTNGAIAGLGADPTGGS